MTVNYIKYIFIHQKVPLLVKRKEKKNSCPLRCDSVKLDCIRLKN